jgi:hypothetical protein
MVASALVDSAIFLGPWGQLKSASYAIGSGSWFIFATLFLVITLGVVPGIYTLAVWAANRVGDGDRNLRQALAHQSQVLVPLGMMGWIAFTISFALAKFSYVLPVVSDPFGWGWNLIGVTRTAWVGQNTLTSMLLQVIVLTIGLFWSTRVALKINKSIKQAVPMIAFSGVFSLAMLWLLIG